MRAEACTFLTACCGDVYAVPCLRLSLRRRRAHSARRYLGGEDLGDVIRDADALTYVCAGRRPSLHARRSLGGPFRVRHDGYPTPGMTDGYRLVGRSPGR